MWRWNKNALNKLVLVMGEPSRQITVKNLQYRDKVNANESSFSVFAVEFEQGIWISSSEW